MLLVLMTNSTDTKTAVATSNRKLTTTSTDGKWKTFHGVPGLMQYVPSGVYFARVKIKNDLTGKSVVTRSSLETDVFTTAKDRLADKVAALRAPKAVSGTFGDGMAKFNQATDNRLDLADTSRVYRHRCVAAILASWPGLDETSADSITLGQMQKWAKDFAGKYAAPFYNGSLNVFREILKLAGVPHDKNPAFGIKRVGVTPKELELPTADQFSKVIMAMRTSGGATSQDNADAAMFFSLSGVRKKESWGVLWQHCDFEANEIAVATSKRRKGSEEKKVRRIPMVPAMRAHLERLKAKFNPKPTDTVCRVKTFDEALTAACKKVGCARLTHHDLRHLFATFCIEAGVPIETLSKWLGHSDGGALAMKTYGHLRREHSQQMAQRVTFGLPTLPAPVQLAVVTA